MAKDQYIQRLKTVPLFASLSKKELNLLLGQADHLRYPATLPGRPRGTRWARSSGWSSTASSRCNAVAAQVATLGPGDYFGELSVIDSSPRDATVIATTPVELLVIGRRRFWATVQGSPTLMRKLMIGLANRLHEADRRESALRGGDRRLGGRPPEGRVLGRRG